MSDFGVCCVVYFSALACLLPGREEEEEEEDDVNLVIAATSTERESERSIEGVVKMRRENQGKRNDTQCTQLDVRMDEMGWE